MHRELIELLGQEHRKKIRNLGDDPQVGREHVDPLAKFGNDPDASREHASPFLVVRRMIRRHEGYSRHMYLDSVGVVTVGIRFSLRKPTEVKHADYTHRWRYQKTGRLADDRIATEGWHNLFRYAAGGRSASSYKNYTEVELSDSTTNIALDRRLREGHRKLRHAFGRADIVFDDLPQSVQVALFDMGYNLGWAYINGVWKKLKRALQERDWVEAARESHRRQVSVQRNAETAQLIRRALEKGNDLNYGPLEYDDGEAD
ncbi:MAG: hypothetical protein AB7P52_13475 [Alphaproteobacteria bacterium]